MIRYIIDGVSDQGYKKEVNQDACFAGKTITSSGEVCFAVVCDGMGGLEAGELASSTIVQELRNWFYEKCELGEDWIIDTYSIHNDLLKVIFECNKSLIQYGNENGFTMGSTVVTGLITPEMVYVMNVGDSRAYRQKDGLYKLSRDHSVVGEDIDSGIITEEEAKKDNRNNVLTQAVGVFEDIEPFFKGYPMQEGCYIFCTDGFYNHVTNKEIIDNVNYDIRSEKEIKDGLSVIVSLNRERGERDDISAIVINVDKT